MGFALFGDSINRSKVISLPNFADLRALCGSKLRHRFDAKNGKEQMAVI
jgi:hypothetical protein